MPLAQQQPPVMCEICCQFLSPSNTMCQSLNEHGTTVSVSKV